MRFATIGVALLTTPAFAQSLINDARVESLARLAVHEERCDLSVNDDAITTYVMTTFDDAAEALSGLSSNISLYGSLEGDLQGLDLTIRCAALRQFAEQNGLLAD